MNIKFIESAQLPSLYGKFQIYAFLDQEGKEHLALVAGKVQGKLNVPVRVHSECLTGEAFGSKRCDCREQLNKALEYIGKNKLGILIYLRQEGRNIGLINKIKAYRLQDQGFDTYSANLELGLPADAREFSVAAEILKYFDISSVRLITNNPEKIAQLEKKGIFVTERISLPTSINSHNRGYLKAKKARGHLL